MGRELDEESHNYELHERDFKSADQMIDIFKDYPAISNTVKIANDCAIEFVTDQVLLPNFDCPDGLSPEAYLEKLVWEGIDEIR